MRCPKEQLRRCKPRAERVAEGLRAVGDRDERAADSGAVREAVCGAARTMTAWYDLRVAANT